MKHVTFPQAQWLKNIEFDVPCQFLYVDGKYKINFEKEGDLFNNGYPSTQKPIDWCLAPEQHQVVDWLLEKHGIWIEVQCPDMKDQLFSFNIHRFQKFGSYGDGTGYKLPKEAYSAAFDYIKDKGLI